MVTPWTAHDAEQFFCDQLGPVLGVPVGSKSATGNEWVRVRRTGGPMATPVSDRPLLAFEAYAALPSRAWQLVEALRVAVLALRGTVTAGVNVKDVDELGGPAELPDPLFEELTRYTVMFAVHLRAIAA